MKAVLRSKYGSPEVLSVGEIIKPIPKDDEVLVRVYATTVNRTDCGILRGKPFLIRFFTGLFKPSSQIPGTDFAGKIESVGKKVTSFKIGDNVWGFNDEGLSSQAEYLTIREDKAVTLIPKGVSYDAMVSCGEGAHYAYNFINKVNLTKDTKVLVNGATGAIGSSAVQLLKYYGVYVTAVGNTKNIDLIKSLGADKVFDYQKEDFTKDDEKYHFIFDAVGKSNFRECKHLLLPKGVYISSELGPNAENIYLPLTTKLFGNKRVIFPIPKNCKRSVLLLTKLIKEDKFKPVIDKKYSIDQIKEAYTYVESGEKTGNVVIKY
ncbi:NAD(P)-dependent alcohol dehydrogenase [Aureibaculum sp. 2210JD6-5]|uniref:NAD(P)-dependent alcohol dehydrogenase n=1 Tax=Aureibaculum sp. 2210JD6-5 TaxID=3103957 RepID=UPI002AAEB961|nr:NAD(P)-dependent alcohol dehydrogenase [Aureibaculum sp. 2210JD6-5]MDY7395133.1 NAD(P)-dependent alcohol dehydrogenase [Aureibaculum sp. 2210JD6-5]